jgi:hypothetical protein
MLEALAAILGFATTARGALTTGGGTPSEEPPPYVVIARWPAGFQAVRVLDMEYLKRVIGDDLGRRPPESVQILMAHPDLFRSGEISAFLFGFSDGVHFNVKAACLTRQTYLEHSARHQAIALVTPSNHAFFLDELRGYIEPRIAWFLFDVLGQQNRFQNITPGHSWSQVRVQLRVPIPVPDEWLDPDQYQVPELTTAIAQWAAHAQTPYPPKTSPTARKQYRAKYESLVREMNTHADRWLRYRFTIQDDTFIEDVRRNDWGSQWTAHWTVFVGEQRFYLKLRGSHGSGAVSWGLSWLSEVTGRARDTSFFGDNWAPDLFTLFQKLRIVWPESSYEEMLDDWLVPGTVLFEDVSMFEAVGAGLPYTYAPDKFWDWVQAQEMMGVTDVRGDTL